MKSMANSIRLFTRKARAEVGNYLSFNLHFNLRFIHFRIYHICRVLNYFLVNMTNIVNCLNSQFYHGRSILKTWSICQCKIQTPRLIKMLVNLEVFFRIDFCFSTDMKLKYSYFEFLSNEKMQNKFQDNNIFLFFISFCQLYNFGVTFLSNFFIIGFFEKICIIGSLPVTLITDSRALLSYFSRNEILEKVFI